MKNLAQMAKGKGEPKSATLAMNGMVIGEKHPRDEPSDVLPSKKGKQAVDSKKKGSMLPLKDKKKTSHLGGISH